MKKIALALAVLWTLAGCGTDSGEVYLSCGDVRNADQVSLCDGTVVAERRECRLFRSALAATVVSTGDVRRYDGTAGSVVGVDSVVVNSTGKYLNGWLRIATTAGCIGSGSSETSWVVLEKQRFGFLAGTTADLHFTFGCGTMELGPQTATMTVWDEDGVTVLDEVVVQFNVVP